jgi:hypothetical protein
MDRESPTQGLKSANPTMTRDLLFIIFPELGQHADIFECRRILLQIPAGGDVAEESTHDFAAAGLG